MNLARARAVADAVLYEGYLLYPYRASSDKNRIRWQFGVLGPPSAAERGVGEESSMSMQCLLVAGSLLEAGGVLAAGDAEPSIAVHLRCLQLQRRQISDLQGNPEQEWNVEGKTWLSWDEAVEKEVAVPLTLAELAAGQTIPVEILGGEETEPLGDGQGSRGATISRRRWPLSARLSASTKPSDGYLQLTLRVDNLTTGTGTRDSSWAVRSSLLGAHLLVEGHGVTFVSLLEPPENAQRAVACCSQHRCWPVLAGDPGDTDLVLGSPIILYDYPEIATESAGALFDATEIDEILTLRVMTMTDEEKAEARATDPRAREIIDRCEAMTPESLQRLHGILRNTAPPSFDTADVPWWDPAADEAVRPDHDAVIINGARVSKGSIVRVHPSRRADAQDLFFADQLARVTAVLSDVDGAVHVALVLADDPAADLHESYGRYFYFAPDELEPLPGEIDERTANRKSREESRP
jgi:hypothetical protein